MALPSTHTDPYELHRIFLVGGKLYAGYQKDGKKYEAQICHVLDGPYAVITTKKIEPDMLSIKISQPFRHSYLIDDNFYVVEKVEKKDGQAYGKQRGRDVHLPIRQNNEDDQILYVWYPDTGQVKLVILEDEVPSTSAKKAAIGVAAAGSAALAVGATPVVVAGLGFSSGGIVAGSLAAKMMSLGLIGVPTLQSIGAAGMGVASMINVGALGSAIGAVATAAGLKARNTATYKIDGKGMATLFLMNNRLIVPIPPVTDILGVSTLSQPTSSSLGPDTPHAKL